MNIALHVPSNRATGNQESEQSCSTEKPPRRATGREAGSSQEGPVGGPDALAARCEQGKLRDRQAIRGGDGARAPFEANNLFWQAIHGTTVDACCEDIPATPKRCQNAPRPRVG
jgi:hypothetical protein